MISISFNRTNPEAVRAARERAATMVEGITKATRSALRTIIADGMDGTRSPRDTAAAIRDLIGLTERDAGAVARMRAEMKDAGESAADIKKATQKYADELLDTRAETIAQTESLNAARAGQVELWDQAREAGLLTGDEVIEWIFTDDEHACDICEFLAGQQVKMGENFVTEDGTEIEPGDGAHPRCRCDIGLTEAASSEAA